MKTGFFIGLGDKTSCGGKVLDGDRTIVLYGVAHAREGDRVSCGNDNETYRIRGGIAYMISGGRAIAGTLDSISSCPCNAELVPSVVTATYRKAATLASAVEKLGTTNSRPTSNKKFGQSFTIIDSETRQPIPNRSYIAWVNGARRSGTTDDLGRAYVETSIANAVIEFHVVFHAPTRELDEFAKVTS
jgi:uncharacterized Zn-binding protein involved in type VI secretion